MSANRPFQFGLFSIFLTLTLLCVVFANPVFAARMAAAMGAAFFGLAIVHAALTSRREGWITGALFGSIFVILGLAGCCLAVVLRWVAPHI